MRWAPTLIKAGFSSRSRPARARRGLEGHIDPPRVQQRGIRDVLLPHLEVEILGIDVERQLEPDRVPERGIPRQDGEAALWWLRAREGEPDRVQALGRALRDLDADPEVQVIVVLLRCQRDPVVPRSQVLAAAGWGEADVQAPVAAGLGLVATAVLARLVSGELAVEGTVARPIGVLEAGDEVF